MIDAASLNSAISDRFSQLANRQGDPQQSGAAGSSQTAVGVNLSDLARTLMGDGSGAGAGGLADLKAFAEAAPQAALDGFLGAALGKASDLLSDFAAPLFDLPLEEAAAKLRSAAQGLQAKLGDDVDLQAQFVQVVSTQAAAADETGVAGEATLSLRSVSLSYDGDTGRFDFSVQDVSIEARSAAVQVAAGDGAVATAASSEVAVSIKSLDYSYIPLDEQTPAQQGGYTPELPFPVRFDLFDPQKALNAFVEEPAQAISAFFDMFVKLTIPSDLVAAAANGEDEQGPAQAGAAPSPAAGPTVDVTA